MFMRTKNGSCPKSVQFTLHAESVFHFNIVHFSIIITFCSWYPKSFLFFRISNQRSVILSFPHGTVRCLQGILCIEATEYEFSLTHIYFRALEDVKLTLNCRKTIKVVVYGRTNDERRSACLIQHVSQTVG